MEQAVYGPAATTVSDAERLEQLDRDLERMPLFMTRLPDESEDNAAVEALKTLVSDDPPEARAQLHKDEGNLCFRRGRFREAAQQYTQALACDHDNRALEAAVLLNRAAANLELRNHGQVLRDCSAVLRLQPKTPKALFRAGRACVALGKFDEALECCRWALGMDPGSRDIARLQAEAERAREEHARRAEARARREEEAAHERELLRRAVEIRAGLAFGRTGGRRPGSDAHPWEGGEHQVRLDRESGHLEWPVVFLYPETKESDFVQRFDEAATLHDVLAQVLAQPPPWDRARPPKYTLDSVDTYFLARPVDGDERDERLVKVAASARLATVLESPKYVIWDGVPSFLVLPRGDPFTAQFVEHYRALRLAREAATTRTAAGRPAT